MKFSALRKLLLACVLLVMSPNAGLTDATTVPVRILVIKSRDITFYDLTLQGFIAGLKSRGYDGPSTVMKIIALTGDAGKDQQTVKQQLSSTNSLIFTLGTDATLVVANAHTTTPCMFSMILDPVSLGVAKSLAVPGGSFTGTTLLVSPGKQLEALQQVDSNVKKVGVLYTAGDPTSTAFLAYASQEAQGLNIQVVSVPITDYDSSGHQALETLAGHVNAFWMIVDPASASPQALADTLSVAKEHRLPILGMSNANVHAGALLSLSANLSDLGDVDAEMAGPLIDGTTTPAQMSVRGPRQTILSLNLDAAKAVGTIIPDSVLHLADEVVGDGNSSPGGF
jgi:putative tryptophan/tyrosine transport system substrate-binding protein